MVRLTSEVRPHERPAFRAGALTVALLGAAVAVVASAGDALFLAHVGPARLGFALAGSSALLIAVLSVVGTLADRAAGHAGHGRLRLLRRLCWLSGLLLAGVALVAQRAPALGGGLALIAGKQLAAAVDLTFWVLLAARMDARQNRRLLPLFAAAHGVGTVVGAFAVGPLAHGFGSDGALFAGALLFLAAGLSARGLARIPAAHTLSFMHGTHERRGARSMVRVVRDSGLAAQLAWVVVAAGVFAPMLYVLLCTAAAESFSDEAALAAFFGQYRGLVQLLTLAAQVFVAPRLFARLGVAPSLIIAPSGALVGALALGAERALVLVVAVQALVKVLDAALQTPAEKLAQNLLPPDIRGRVAAFLDGVAKRAGAIAGGAAASALAFSSAWSVAALVVVAALWWSRAFALRRRFADLAVAELSVADARAQAALAPEPELELFADGRSIERLRAGLRGEDAGGQDLAIELLTRLAEAGRVDLPVELALAAVDAHRPVPLLRALCQWLENPGAERVQTDWRRAAYNLLTLLDELIEAADAVSDGETPIAAVRALGCLARGDDARRPHGLVRGLPGAYVDAVASQLELAAGAAAQRGHAGWLLAAHVARMRVGGRDAMALLEDHPGSGSAEADVAFDELRTEVALALADRRSSELVLERTWSLANALRRRARVCPDRASAEAGVCIERVLAYVEPDNRHAAELSLLGSQISAMARAWAEPDAPAPLRLAGVSLLARTARPEQAGVLAAALDSSDERVRAAGMRGLARLGGRALEVLLATSRYARRSARAAAATVLRELRFSHAALERAIDGELATIDRTTVHIAVLADLPHPELLLRRLQERRHEATYALFAMLEALLARPGLAVIAGRMLGARQQADPARTLETLDTLLPRPLSARVTAVLEDGLLAPNPERAGQRLGGLVTFTRERAVASELTNADPLTRSLLLHALGASGRAAHRESISAAAADAARDADPREMLRRLMSAPGAAAGQQGPEDDDMPRSVDTVITLSRISLFAELSTRQLAELARSVEWRSVAEGQVIVRQGESGDAMYFVAGGRVCVDVADQHGAVTRLGELGPGEPFGEMALFEDLPRSATVTAQAKARVGRIARADFEHLVDQMPSIALAACRALGRRIREQNQR